MRLIKVNDHFSRWLFPRVSSWLSLNISCASSEYWDEATEASLEHLRSMTSGTCHVSCCDITWCNMTASTQTSSYISYLLDGNQYTLTTHTIKYLEPTTHHFFIDVVMCNELLSTLRVLKGNKIEWVLLSCYCAPLTCCVCSNAIMSPVTRLPGLNPSSSVTKLKTILNHSQPPIMFQGNGDRAPGLLRSNSIATSICHLSPR